MSEQAASQAEAVDVFNGENPSVAEFTEYRETGKIPDRFKPAEHADPAPADTEQPPAAESEDEQEKPRHKLLSANERITQLRSTIEKLWRAEEPDTIKIAQLDATIDRIENQRAGKSRKTEAAPVTQQPDAPRSKPTADDKNQDGTPKYQTYEDFVEDLADWKAEQRQAQWEQKQAQIRQTEELVARVNEGKELYGDDFAEIANTIAGQIHNDKDIPLLVKQRIAKSPLMAHLMYTLGSDPEALANFAKSAKSDQFAALDYIAISEAGIREALSQDQPRDAKGQFTETPAKPKTNAPKPPVPVSGASKGAFDVSDESLSNEDWRTKRNAQLGLV